MVPKTWTAHGKHIYGRVISLAEALEYFSAEKDIEFDNLYPVYDHPDGRVTALPVKEMNAVYLAYKLGKEGSRHGFVMMLCWLQTSMEISEVRCLSVQISIIYSHVRRPIELDQIHTSRVVSRLWTPTTTIFGQSWMYT
ncbi:hypothetical protein JG688_00011578 [Phytophthora aleatoria]|uniref:Uncharacterized protein n=1 Tax=Phytophthora aleatoria TaxID=2496075 RepID=A0A8J5IT87_9STRA|nr:hypothetical protein JG688_00011578 [Phytophthora aleatoria]